MLLLTARGGDNIAHIFDGEKTERCAPGLREVEKSRVEGIAGRSRGERRDGSSSTTPHEFPYEPNACLNRFHLNRFQFGT